MSDDSINLALQLTIAGETTKARQLLIRALKQDPYNEQAWIALSEVVEEQEQVIHCSHAVPVFPITYDHADARRPHSNFNE